MKLMRQAPNDDAKEVAAGVCLSFGDPTGFNLCIRASNGHGLYVLELDNDDIDHLSDTFAILRAFNPSRYA